MPEAVPLEKLKEYVGQEIGLTDWVEITQDKINLFADATGDHQWIHVDEEKAKSGPFGKTIAHGYLALSMLPMLSASNKYFPAGIKMALNYGSNKIRFINTVPVGSRIRNRAVLKDITEKGEGRILMTVENTIELEGQEKPAMVAETLSMFLI